MSYHLGLDLDFNKLLSVVDTNGTAYEFGKIGKSLRWVLTTPVELRIRLIACSPSGEIPRAMLLRALAGKRVMIDGALGSSSEGHSGIAWSSLTSYPRYVNSF